MEQKVISVDFDDTLFIDPSYEQNGLWVPSGLGPEPIIRVHNFIKEKHKEGYEIHVVSFRKEEDKREMIHLSHLYELPIKSFICTESKNKTPFLKSLNSVLHIDDNVEVLVLAKMAGIEGLLVDHGQKDINSTAELFVRI